MPWATRWIWLGSSMTTQKPFETIVPFSFKDRGATTKPAWAEATRGQKCVGTTTRRKERPTARLGTFHFDCGTRSFSVIGSGDPLATSGRTSGIAHVYGSPMRLDR